MASGVKSHRGEIIVAGGFLAVAIAMVWMATGFYGDARILPLLVGSVLVVLLTLNFVVEVRRSSRSGMSTESAALPAEETTQSTQEASSDHVPSAASDLAQYESDQGQDGMRLQRILVWLGALCIMFYFLGLIWTAILFTTAFMRFVGGLSLLRIAPTVAALLAMFYALVEFLTVRIYDGWLFTEGILPALLIPF